MDGYQANRPGKGPSPNEIVIEVLSRLEDQGRQTLELVRSLVTLLVPRQAVREGPSLEDLMAVLIAQQRETISIAKTIHEEIQRQAESLPLAVAAALDEQTGHLRVVRS